MISPNLIDPTSQEIRILSLWQPWASFIAWRLKQYETRSWHTAYRGLIAIHAAKRQIDAEGLHLIGQVFQLSGSHQRDICEVKSYPLGAIVAVCELTDCRVMRHAHPQAIGTGIEIEAQTELERAVGNWQNPRYAFQLGNVLALPEPMTFRGSQGLRRLDAETVRAIERHIGIGSVA